MVWPWGLNANARDFKQCGRRQIWTLCLYTRLCMQYKVKSNVMATCFKYVAFKTMRLRVWPLCFLRGVFSVVKTISITINFCWKGLWYCQVAAFQETWQESITRMHSHYDLLDPYVTFRKVLFQVLNRLDYLPQHLLEFSMIARKVYSSFPILLCQWVHVAIILSYIH